MREPVAIGFYPDDPEELRQTIESFLDDVKVKEMTPRALLVPHAGYPFSGKTAAFSYKALKGKDYSNVILLGPNHYGVGPEIAVSGEDWKTPLGEVKLNREIANKITQNSGARTDNKAHEREHSIEVQLPFLQYVLSDFEIVPISIKHEYLDKNSLNDLGEVLRELSDEETLIIASSDLVHFGPNYRYMPVQEDRVEFVEEKDREFIDKVVQFDPDGVLEIGEDTTVCGYGGIAALLMALKDQGIKASILEHSTSYDVRKDENNIVGYASIAFF